MEKLFTSPPQVECLSSLKSHHSKKELGHWQFQKGQRQRATRRISQLGNPSITVLQAKHLGEVGLIYLSLCQLRSKVIGKDEFHEYPEGQESQKQATEGEISSSSSKPQQVYFMFCCSSSSSTVFVSQDRDLRETNVSRKVYGGRRGIRRLQTHVVSSGIVNRSSSPGVIEVSFYPQTNFHENSKFFVLLARHDFRLLNH